MLRFYRVPTINILEQNEKILYIPINPDFATIEKWGVSGSTLHGDVSMMRISENGSSITAKVVS